MPIHRGSELVAPHRGDEELSAVYRGSELVWTGGEPAPTRINYFSGRPTGMYPVQHPEAGFHQSWFGASGNGSWTNAVVADDPIARGTVLQRVSTGFLDLHGNRIWSLISRGSINNDASEIEQPTLYLEKGKTYTLSFYLWSSLGGPGGSLLWIPLDGADDEIEHEFPSVDASQWVRLSHTFTASFGATGGPIQAPPTGIDQPRPGEWVPMYTNLGASGSINRYTGFLLEEGTEVRPYFDGDSPDAVWMGTPNQSMSLYYGAVNE